MFLIDWWNSLSTAAQIFACMAIPATLILLIQTILAAQTIGRGNILYYAIGGHHE